jgi:drug/metabolite transporter (DMT)-like permease
MWIKFAAGEGLTKTVSALFQKLIGKSIDSLEMGCVAAIIIGTIQTAAGLLGFTKKGKVGSTLFPDKRSVLWAIAFGFIASIFGTVWSIHTFTLGADIGIRTMLIMGSIVPGAIIGRIFWKDKLGLPQILGIIIFLAAIWTILGFPLMSQVPIWVWAVLVITLTQAFSEALSRKASIKLDVWVNNFWVGLSTIFFSLMALIILAIWHGGAEINLGRIFLLGSIGTGTIVAVMISFKLITYAKGGTIALKKIVMQGTYLITATTAGILFYHEPFNYYKVVGIVLLLVSVILMDKEVGRAIISSDRKATVLHK